MWSLVMYSNYFEWNNVSFCQGLFVFNILFIILYHYTTNDNFTWYNICKAWFLDIRISTCSVHNHLVQVIMLLLSTVIILTEAPLLRLYFKFKSFFIQMKRDQPHHQQKIHQTQEIARHQILT